jgi:predicted DNA-binding transcriptional regulator YafY
LFRDFRENGTVLETSARLLRLLGLLQSRRDWTGGQLAERLGVTDRTVRTDVERLRALGYAVDAAPGVGGGYRLGVGAAVPPLLLDDDEAVAVAIGLRTATLGPVEGIDETAVRALTKLEQLLPARLRRRVATLSATLVPLTADGRTGSRVMPEVLMSIAAACRDHERLRFDYATHEGTPSRRLVEPHRLVSSGLQYYLLAHDVERGDWRTFRVDRMQLHLPAGPRFSPRELSDAEVDAQVSAGIARAPWSYRASVVVDAPAAHLASRLPRSIPVQPIDETTCRVEVGSDSPEQLARYLAMLDADFTIDGDTAPELSDALRSLAGRLGRAAYPAR